MNCKKCGNEFVAGEELWHGMVKYTKVLICTECGFRKTPIYKDELAFWEIAEKFVSKSRKKSGFDCIDRADEEESLDSDVKSGGRCSCGGSCGDECRCNQPKTSGGCGSCGGCKH